MASSINRGEKAKGKNVIKKPKQKQNESIYIQQRKPGVMDHPRGRPAPRPLFHNAKDNQLIGEIIIFKVLFP